MDSAEEPSDRVEIEQDAATSRVGMYERTAWATQGDDRHLSSGGRTPRSCRKSSVQPNCNTQSPNWVRSSHTRKWMRRSERWSDRVRESSERAVKMMMASGRHRIDREVEQRDARDGRELAVNNHHFVNGGACGSLIVQCCSRDSASGDLAPVTASPCVDVCLANARSTARGEKLGKPHRDLWATQAKVPKP